MLIDTPQNKQKASGWQTEIRFPPEIKNKGALC